VARDPVSDAGTGFDMTRIRHVLGDHCGCGDPEDCAHDEYAAVMRRGALMAGRKPWDWSKDAYPGQLRLRAFLARPWIWHVERYDNQTACWRRMLQPHIRDRFEREGRRVFPVKDIIGNDA
jgi:hypothetical protein